MLGIFGLNQHFAASVLTTGASGHLHDGLGEPLGGTEIGAEQTLVGVCLLYTSRCV